MINLRIAIIPLVFGVVLIASLGQGARANAAYALPPHVVAACDQYPTVGHFGCLALVRTDRKNLATPKPLTLAQVLNYPIPHSASAYPLIRLVPKLLSAVAAKPQRAGYLPPDLWIAYNIRNETFTNGTGQIIAVVDAYDDPAAESDLAIYRHEFDLLPCTSQSGCFRKVDEYGNNLLKNGAQLPQPDAHWSMEISLDLDMVSAICQRCNIVLIEASSDSISDFDNAMDTAANLGATVISNSYGQPSDATDEDPHYNKPNIVIVASAGDSGYGPEIPASYPNVVAVGGTTMLRAANYPETVWNGTGGGCSHVAKPRWQTDGTLIDGSKGCGDRTANDIAAVADPNTGVAVYDTYQTNGVTTDGWLTEGGTSAAAPIIAGMFALAGHTKTQNGPQGLWLDAGAHTKRVIGESNGNCTLSYLCQGLAYAIDDNSYPYTGPTGWGSPFGLGAFSQDVVPAPSPLPTASSVSKRT